MAIKKKSGARGLRGVIEDTMMDVMFEIPSQDNIQEVIITKESVEGKEPVKIIKKK